MGKTGDNAYERGAAEGDFLTTKKKEEASEK